MLFPCPFPGTWFRDALSLSFSRHLRTFGWNSLWAVWKKIKTKPYRKGQALQLGAISHSHAATHRSAVSVSEMRSRKRLNSTVITLGIPKSEHFSVRGFPAGSAGKESTCNAADLGLIPGLGRSLGEGNATHSSILVWRIPWTVQSMGLQRVGQDWVTFS